MRTFQKENCCKKWGKIVFRHHFICTDNPKVLVVSQAIWFSEKFRKERLCCLVESPFLSFNPSCDRNESYEILAFIYFRTSLTFLNFGQQMLTFSKKSKHGGILEFFKLLVLQTFFYLCSYSGTRFSWTYGFPVFEIIL